MKQEQMIERSICYFKTRCERRDVREGRLRVIREEAEYNDVKGMKE